MEPFFASSLLKLVRMGEKMLGARSNQFSNVFKGTWGGIYSRNSSYFRNLSCDNGDTGIWNAELTRGFYCLRSV